MPSEDPAIGSVHDADGRDGRSAGQDLDEKISRDHPEPAEHLDAVLQAVSKPDHVEPDPCPDRKRYYRRNVGPSGWLLVVVSYEQQPARIITALANRKDPKTWKP